MPRHPEPPGAGPPDAPRSPAEQDLRTFLEQDREMYRRAGHDLTAHGYAYSGPADFLLRHGRWYQPRPLPKSYRRGAPKQCYGNALLTAVTHEGRLFYVEGYASVIIPVPHAWCEDAQGRLYEVTWPEPGAAYLGVCFGVERADDCTWKGDGCVLDDWRRGFPVLRQPWTGEPAAFPWQPSPWLTLVRQGRLAEAHRWLVDHRDD